jgi:excisionase family DNA binding protein
MKRTLNYTKKWSDEALEILCSRYGELSPEGIAKVILMRTGISFNPAGIYRKASLLGLKASENQGRLTIAEMARQANIGKGALKLFMKKHGLVTQNRLRHRFIAEEDVEFIMQAFAPRHDNYLSVEETAKSLRVTKSTVRQLTTQGKLVGIFKGRLLYICPESIARRKIHLLKSLHARRQKQAERLARLASAKEPYKSPLRSPEVEAYLRKVYPTKIPVKKIAELLHIKFGISVNPINLRGFASQDLKIKKRPNMQARRSA